jgi:hypothetical protein
VAKLTPDQQRKRERVEAVIGVMAPALTVLLAAGDRISRILQPEDHEYYPARHAEASPQGGPTAPKRV